MSAIERRESAVSSGLGKLAKENQRDENRGVQKDILHSVQTGKNKYSRPKTLLSGESGGVAVDEIPRSSVMHEVLKNGFIHCFKHDG